jgi:hypothetical protein
MLLTTSRQAQYPLVQEFIFNYGDTMVDINGVTQSFSAVGAPVVKVFNVPAGAVMRAGDIIIETAYVGPTVATVAVGDSGSATKYAAATNLLSAARTSLTVPNAVSGGLDVLLTFSFTVAAATAGRVRVRFEYTIEGRGNEVQST